MTLRHRLIPIACLVLAACASGAAGPSDVPTPTAVASVPPSAEATRSTAPVAAPSASAGGELLRGVLGFDGIEGGCPYLETADGTRYQVRYPDGYGIDPSSGDLIGPSGAVHVPLGGEIAVRGVMRGDLGSTCQIGPIFQAFEVIGS